MRTFGPSRPSAAATAAGTLAAPAKASALPPASPPPRCASGTAAAASASPSISTGFLSPRSSMDDSIASDDGGAGVAGSEGEKPPLRFTPFAQGPRNCIGELGAVVWLALLLCVPCHNISPPLAPPPPLCKLTPCRRSATTSVAPGAAAGQSLAKMNYSTVLAALISRFTFHVPEELRGPGALWDLQTNLLTNQPRDTLRMRCIPRPTS